LCFFPVVVVVPVPAPVPVVVVLPVPVEVVPVPVPAPVVVVLPVPVEAVVEFDAPVAAPAVVAAIQFPNPPAVVKDTSMVPLVAWRPAGTWTTRGCEPTSVGDLSPFVVTVAAWKLLPVPVGSI